MADILIRRIPKKLKDWIDDQSYTGKTSANSFSHSVLESVRETKEDYLPLFDEPRHVRPLVASSVPFTFCDFFAGIGGFRIGMESVGGECVFSCEYDKYAQKTYAAWFGHSPSGDIRDLDLSKIPDHDVLTTGFPCQPFSIAGVSKKNSLGRKHGFQDKTQGTLFFHLATIIEIKRPPVIVLENVKNLISHDKGRTWEVIQDTLAALDYEIHFKVINAADYVPQHRKRIFIIGFDSIIFKGKSGFLNCCFEIMGGVEWQEEAGHGKS